MAEMPDQFVDYMVMNKVVIEENEQGSDEEEPETYLNNYLTKSDVQDTLRPLNTGNGNEESGSPNDFVGGSRTGTAGGSIGFALNIMNNFSNDQSILTNDDNL